MTYTIRKLDSFSTIGLEVELTNNQASNAQIAKRFWTEFNSNLKKQYLLQSGNWTKYAFMERRSGKLLYYCAIPKRTVVSTFIEKNIKKQMYLVVEHIGTMERLPSTYSRIYKELIPNSEFEVIRDDFLHFEKYDQRFHWNRENSIIEIWIPIRNVDLSRRLLT